MRTSCIAFCTFNSPAVSERVYLGHIPMNSSGGNVSSADPEVEAWVREEYAPGPNPRSFSQKKLVALFQDATWVIVMYGETGLISHCVAFTRLWATASAPANYQWVFYDPMDARRGCGISAPFTATTCPSIDHDFLTSPRSSARLPSTDEGQAQAEAPGQAAREL